MNNFEWDSQKNQLNRSKHKVSFEQASEIFSDPLSIEKIGRYRNEWRFLRIGKTQSKIILIVVYTLRKDAIRLISARQANSSERLAYLKHCFSNKPNTNDENID